MKLAPVKGHSGWGRGRPPPGKLVQTLARKKVRTVLKWQDKNLSYPWGPGIPTEKANLCHQKHELTSIGEDVETGAPVGCGGDLSWGSCCEKLEIPPEIKNITALRLNNRAKYLSSGIKIRILKSYLHSHAHWSTIHSNQGMEAT